MSKPDALVIPTTDAFWAAPIRRANLIRAAGFLIILLSAGAALLPFLGPIRGTMAIGILLLTAGAVETIAGTMRHETRALAMIAGAATALAGLMFLFNTSGQLLSSVTVVTIWLFARAAILALTSARAHGRVKAWLQVSAITDTGLGVALLAGLSVMTLVVLLFGPVPQLITSFAWVLALSFLATGTLLIEVASCEVGHD